MRARRRVVDQDLASTAAALMSLPRDVFLASPFEGHTSCTTWTVSSIALALSESLDLTVQCDKRPGAQTSMRLAHTVASTGQLPSWAQARLTTSLFCLGLLLAAWHFKIIDGDQHLALEGIDDLLARIAPVDIAYHAGGHKSYLPDDLRGVATDMTATIEAVDPEDLPYLRELADDIDCEYMRDTAPNIERMIKGYKVFVEEDWLKSRGLQDNDRLRGVIRRACGDGNLINQLFDPATRLGGRYLKRIEEIEAHYGGEVPKDNHGYPLLWFGLCTDDFSQVYQLAHRALSRMLFKCDQEQVVRDEEFEITISFLAFTVLIEVWCVHFLQYGHADPTLGLRLNLSGFLTSTKPTLAAHKEHGSLMWDGKDVPVAEIKYLNIQVQISVFNCIIKRRPASPSPEY
ncbi:hypothetical protein BDZ90DRAFT_275688 [Jaminaea rosea]|uniref:Uncharacterized protein n=1 Tax=Jaminaea rosea TaxID=1569628 RepID=A0A316UN88_9BASI|nr:hypothetical protein BDZ90DRAFT_275688 [Jaminaea rosea]PWN25811.1 hypothetical protein BDZ90DRAFT_275688 [Jaminaea rosea]